MATLFDPVTVGGLELPNRMIMAPMTRSRADERGLQTDIVPEYYRQRAGAGLIISEAVNVSPMATGYVRTSGFYNPEQIAAWKRVIDAVHDAGGRIFVQFFHTGRIALPDFLPGGVAPVAPSAIAAKGQNYTDEGMKDFVTPRSLDVKEIAGIVTEFAQAAKNAVNAGADGVELHAASGYLHQQFLMAHSNQRTDQYGGSLENRMRFLLETLDALREAVGANRVGLKLSPQMPFNDIEEPDAETEYPQIVNALCGKELAYLHVGRFSAVDWHGLLRPHWDGTFFAGAGFDKAKGNALLASGGADAIVYGTLFVANPDLPARFARDAPLNAPDKNTFYASGPHGYTDYPTLEAA